MDTKQKLLLFLYKNRHSSYDLEINHIFKDCDLRPIDIQALIGDLKRNKIIETNSKYTLLGCCTPSLPNKPIQYFTFDNVVLKAKLVSITGEQYVRDNYLIKTNTPKINAGQVVYANGDIIAPIYQANDHSSSSTSFKKEAKTPIKNPPKTIMKKLFSIKNMLIIIISVIAGLILYFMTKYLENI